MSAISTITSGEMNFQNSNFPINDDVLMRNMDFKNDPMDDSMSTNMDGKRMRKAVFRRTIDYNSSVALFIEQRTWKRKYSSRCAIQPDIMYQHLLTPPMDYRDNPMNCVCAKHVRTSTNKNKCPIYAVCWTPDGRRLITGASSGEFTLWNGLTFNFETILQAHDTHIRAMKWSNNEEWLVSTDDSGFVKYWQANMNDVNVFQAHKDSVRGVSFCPSDKKFVTCSNDNTVRIWDFQTYKEERVLRGHGGEVRCVAWHPTKSLLLSGSKDSQQPLKLWDPKAGECISTMYVHKSTCTDIGINKNGNWFLTASKDHYIKLFDLRNLKTEMQVFRGHKKDVIRVAWHPYHETLFASGSGDGALLYWLVGTDMEVGAVEDAHENIIWSLDWHPMGHILASGSNDFATKFWTRNRPGDVLKDNLQEEKISAIATNKTEPIANNPDAELENMMKQSETENVFEFDIHKLSSAIAAEIDKAEKSDIPGLSEGLAGADHDSGSVEEDFDDKDNKLKGAVSRTIPKQFSANWANKKSTPAVYTNEPNAVFAANPQSILPIIAIPPPVRPTIFPNNMPVAPLNRLPPAHDLPPFSAAAAVGPPHTFQDESSKISSIDEAAMRIMRGPPMQHASRTNNNNFRPPRNNANMPPNRNSMFQQNFPNSQPMFRPFAEFRPDSAGASPFGANFENHHEPPFGSGPLLPPPHQNNNYHGFNRTGPSVANSNQANNDYHGNHHRQQPHPSLMRQQHFRPEFNDDRSNDQYMGRSRPHLNNQNRRPGAPGGRYGQPPPPQRIHNRQQSQYHHDESENPFEPSKSTGSSKSFIPLQDEPPSSHNRRNKGRMNNTNSNRSNNSNW